VKKLNPSFDSRGCTVIYDDLKGKIFNQLRVFRIGASTSIDLLFEDKTMFHISLEPEPLVRLCLYEEDRAGDLEEIAKSETIPVPQNGQTLECQYRRSLTFPGQSWEAAGSTFNKGEGSCQRNQIQK
jgi:hypothetical protein